MTYMSIGSPFLKIHIRKTASVETEKMIKSLKFSHTYGYDEISNNILKACKTFISTPNRLKYAKLYQCIKGEIERIYLTTDLFQF
jgi:hypothetical protein